MTEIDRPPDIPGPTTTAGLDVWYCRRRMVWVLDPADLALDDAALGVKYGSAIAPDKLLTND